jgi:SAM-dependent MidA family methyltransferase
MGSSGHSLVPAVSAEFQAVFRARAGTAGQLRFDAFMELALYDPSVGYYRRDRPRVGYGPGTDFFTASTSGPVFGELIAATCVTLLGGNDPGEFTFIEVGAEPGRGVLNGVAHPFRAARCVGLGESAQLQERCVVFSNELFDAQPFRRFVHRAGNWRELGVALRGEQLFEIEQPTEAPANFPITASEGYAIDAPLAASALLDSLAGQAWSGLFVACDYGKSWPELAEATPSGTARAYYQHTQSNDLLARPGEQDLTCHICWDWLAERLTAHGFSPPVIESQEAFFVKHAGDYLAATTAREAAHFSQKKRSLLQLLHPAHLGRKFQVLHATRGLVAAPAKS